MSAESMAPPVYLLKLDNQWTVVWGHCSASDKDYYIKVLYDDTLSDTAQDRSEELRRTLSRFDAWKRNSGLK
jgi:hypothetical protein